MITVLPLTAIVPLALFMAILLAAALCGLAASGHFPREHRAAALATPLGAGILHGSMALCTLSMVIGVALIAPIVPWYAAVIGGGAVILATPLLLQPLPDHFVNGRGALLTFAGTSALMAALLICVVG